MRGVRFGQGQDKPSRQVDGWRVRKGEEKEVKKQLGC